MIVRFLINGQNTETSEFDSVPIKGTVITGRIGRLVVGDIVSRATELFQLGIEKVRKEVLYLNAVKWIATVPTAESKAKTQLFGKVAQIISIRKLSSVPIFGRSANCAKCSQPHGQFDVEWSADRLILCENDRGIICVACAQEHEPAMAKAVSDYYFFGIHTDESEPQGWVEARAKAGVTLNEMPVELRRLADRIQLKLDYTKEAA